MASFRGLGGAERRGSGAAVPGPSSAALPTRRPKCPTPVRKRRSVSIKERGRSRAASAAAAEHDRSRSRPSAPTQVNRTPDPHRSYGAHGRAIEPMTPAGVVSRWVATRGCAPPDTGWGSTGSAAIAPSWQDAAHYPRCKRMRGQGTRPKPRPVIPGRSRGAAEGKGTQRKNAAALRLSVEDNTVSLTGQHRHAGSPSPPPWRAPAGDDRGQAASESLQAARGRRRCRPRHAA